MPTFGVGDYQFSVASQKHHVGFYACEASDLERYAKELEGVDCGKSCIRFRNVVEMPADVIRSILTDYAS